MKWLKDKLGRAFWWVVLILLALIAFAVAFFRKGETPQWFGKILDKEMDKQDRKRTVNEAKKGLAKLEEERDKRIEKDAVRADSRVDSFRDRVSKRRKEADAGKPD